ncbi:energy-coupling factor ABC transporter ATP-binding protein, partial [Agromyces albus]
PLPLTPAELAVALDANDVLPPPLDDGRDERGGPDASTGAGTAVSVRHLTVRRGGRRGPEVVHDVHLDVARGDFLAIVGANGAGKTTLLQAIAGVIPPPRSTVDLGGVDPARADARTLARSIGFVFQNPEHQFITHSVAEELEHGLRLQGAGDAERAARVTELLERFGLEELREQHPFLLSGGQKRRLSVGTALVAGAPVLALDEPTFGQDRGRAAELIDMLAELNREGTTVIIVTHDLQLVADSASHVAVMRDGRVIGTGRTADVLAGPLLAEAGLTPPPLARATRLLERHPEWHGVARLDQLPGSPVRVRA